MDVRAGGDDGSDDVPLQVRGWGSIQLPFFLFISFETKTLINYKFYLHPELLTIVLFSLDLLSLSPHLCNVAFYLHVLLRGDGRPCVWSFWSS